jgi:hypothetical protein
MFERMFATQSFDMVPAGLDAMAPGPVLAGWLSSIDVDAVSGHDRVVVLRAHQRMASHYAAAVYADMAAVGEAFRDVDDDPRWVGEAASAEIRAALTLTRRAADIEFGFALELGERLPRVAEALAVGVIDVRRARTIVHGTVHLAPETARTVVDRVIDDAPGLTTGQLAARIRRLCIDVDPEEAEERYRQAVTDRRVVSEATESGTANLLGLDLAPHRVAAATRRIDRLARSLRGGEESRTMDQLRADVLLDLLTGNARHGKTVGGVVDIRVDLATLTRLVDHPGELAGYGPVIADIARRAAEAQPDAEWRYTVTDPDTGVPVAVGTTRRRPSASQRRLIEAAYETCVFPGCRTPAVQCDLDHRVPWSEGGATTAENLGPVCRHDHVVVRHRIGWIYRRLPNGDHQWTSPLGHTYTTKTDRKPP